VNLITKKLVTRGNELLAAPRKEVKFIDDDAANALINDLQNRPHAFVLACILDRQVRAERAWIAPYKLAQRIGDFRISSLKKLSVRDITRFMSKPDPLHRFVDTMSVALHAGIERIVDEYNGDASLIWKGRLSSAEVVYRFLQFKGVGPKIATMATNILARDFKVRFSDYHSIDISADVHVRRVFGRLGFCPPDASVEEVIYRARSLYPEFPGIMDLACWEIGRHWCGSRKLRCKDCFMKGVCPTGISRVRDIGRAPSSDCY
jgi:endonuclease III